VNAVRLAVGTLTVLPVRPPGSVDRRTAGRAMLLAPLVGVLLAVPVVLLTLLTEWLSPLLVAALVVAALALLTRGMHLDGLADTADGLGSGRPAPAALEVMRRGDVGPFGVVTLVLVLLLQVAALAQLSAAGQADLGVVAALVTSRMVLPVACISGVPAARPEGLGATVAGSVPRPAALAAVLLVLVGLAVGTAATGAGPGALVAAVLGSAAGALMLVQAVRRLNGVTGDVLGAVVEVTFTVTLVVLCFG
jgi:adenosylcobinamide-GDP ribazoletransferase